MMQLLYDDGLLLMSLRDGAFVVKVVAWRCICLWWCCMMMPMHAFWTLVQDFGPVMGLRSICCWNSCPRGVWSYDDGIQILWWESGSGEPVVFTRVGTAFCCWIMHRIAFYDVNGCFDIDKYCWAWIILID